MNKKMNNVEKQPSGHKERPTALIPLGFDPREFLPHHLLPKADSVRWLVGYLISQEMLGHADKDHYVALDTSVINSVIGERIWEGDDGRSGIRDALVGPVLETRPHMFGCRSQGYRVKNEWCSNQLDRVTLQDPGLAAAVQAFRQQREEHQKRLMLPVYGKMRAVQQSLEVDQGAYEMLDALDDRCVMIQDSLLDWIRKDQAGFFVTATGRCHNAITGLSRKLLPFVSLGGERLVGVGLQGGLLAMLGTLFHPSRREDSRVTDMPLFRMSRKWFHGVDLICEGRPSDQPLYSSAEPVAHLLNRLYRGELKVTPDSKFSELAFGGTLPDFLRARAMEIIRERIILIGGECTDYPNDCIDTDWVKERFCRDVLGTNPNRTGYSLLAGVTRRHFPGVLEFCQGVNEGVGDLVAALECLEAMLVIHGVVPLLQGAGVPCLTSHDTVWAKRSDVGKVKEAFEEVFDDCGFRVPLKTEG